MLTTRGLSRKTDAGHLRVRSYATGSCLTNSNIGNFQYSPESSQNRHAALFSVLPQTTADLPGQAGAIRREFLDRVTNSE